MLRYENKGQTIEIRLPKQYGYGGYSVECRYMPDSTEGKYLLSMWIKKDKIDDKFKIDSQEIDTQQISGTRETIKSNICKIVEQACRVGFFDRYIESYEYTQKCFERGNDLFENGGDNLNVS